jgi:hypothetical protein
MAQFRHKPTIVEAVRWTGENWPEMDEFTGHGLMNNRGFISIQTPEGMMRCDPGDYMARGVMGEFYPVKDQIFKENYDAV